MKSLVEEPISTESIRDKFKAATEVRRRLRYQNPGSSGVFRVSYNGIHQHKYKYIPDAHR